ncbi:MAG: CPBP family intramembrane metalloprotease [Bacilli bacterium]|nr:CPBP family intramembrane metalloprotease [Bacilli bacterium]
MLKKYENLFKNVIRGILVLFLFNYSSIFLLLPVLLFNLDTDKLSGSMQVILSTYLSVVVALILCLIYRKDLKNEWKKFKDNFMYNIDTGFKCWVIGLIIMVVCNLILLTVFKTGGANNENAVQSMIKSLPWLMIIDAGIIAPFNEEIVFRKTLKDVFKNKWLFVVLSFLLFGAVHVVGGATKFTDYLYIIPYGALGGAFALAYYKTDTVFTSMSLHMFHNLLLTLISILA